MTRLADPRPPMLLRGAVRAAAYWLPPGSVDPLGQVLARWTPGTEVRQLEGGWLVVLDREGLAETPGMPLVRNGGLVGIEGATARAGEVLLAWQGRRVTAVIAQLPHLDLAALLPLPPFDPPLAEPLGPPPLPPRASEPVQLRTVLRRAPPMPSAALLQVSLSNPAALPAWKRGISAAAQWLGGLGRAPAAARGPGGPAGRGVAAGGAAGGAAANALVPTTQPAPVSSWRKALDRLLAPLQARLMGAVHGGHLMNLLDSFNAGKIDEALKWAIPLGTGTGGGEATWGLPRPREALQVRPAGSAPRTSIGITTDVFSQLRELYHEAVQRLIAEGRLDDAVFVLAELLGDYERAVKLLEGAGRFASAAQIAEGRLPPDRAIALWTLAGRMEEAVHLARRTGPITAVLLALEAVDKPRAIGLRWAWAQHLAERGDMAAAATFAWSEPTLRPMAVPWLDAAISSQTPAGARLLALLLRQTPETWALVQPRVEAVCRGVGPEAVRIRLAVAEGLGEAGGAHGRRLLLPVVRQLLLDHATRPDLVGAAWLRGQSQGVSEPAFRADSPAVDTAATPLPQREVPTHVTGGFSNAPIYDATFLADGTLVVAFGELGTVVHGRDGKVLARFPEPCHHLIPIEGTARVIALARSRRGVRLRGIDTRAGTDTPWHDATYTVWEPRCDGNRWLVGDDLTLIALDVLQVWDAGPKLKEPRALWKTVLPGAQSEGGERPRLSGIHAIVRDGKTVALQTGGVAGERWVLRGADLQAVGRHETVVGPHAILLADGTVVTAEDGTAKDITFVVHLKRHPVRGEAVGITLGMGSAPGVPFRLLEQHAFGACQVHTFQSAGAMMAVLRRERLIARVIFPSAQRLCVQIGVDTVTLGDDRGRVMVVDLGDGGVLRGA